jgi:hypothetical protein
MPLFSDEQDVYAVLGTMFRHLVVDPELTDQLKAVDTIVQYQFNRPESTITVKMLAAEDCDVQFGPTTWNPEVIMAMDADVAHRFFLGRLNPTLAFSRNDIRARGPLAKVLRLIPLVAPLHPRYEAQVKESGREELVSA